MNKMILGSQSPQRRRLLESIAGPTAVTILPPLSEDEPGFQDLATPKDIEERLKLVVQLKMEDVCRQLRCSTDYPASATVICADTVVVCFTDDDSLRVLGKPPVHDWQNTVRRWFQEYYSDRAHEVWTGFQITSGDRSKFQIVKASVEFPVMTDDWIDWYIGTEEPVGKAGGYGIQGHAAAFVKAIHGSLTTIIGLPVWEVREALLKSGAL